MPLLLYVNTIQFIFVSFDKNCCKNLLLSNEHPTGHSLVHSIQVEGKKNKLHTSRVGRIVIITPQF